MLDINRGIVRYGSIMLRVLVLPALIGLLPQRTFRDLHLTNRRLPQYLPILL